MTPAFLLIGIAIVVAWPARILLARARWTERTPRASVALWQALGLSFGIAIFGSCFELASSVSTGAGPRRHLTDTSHTIAALPTRQLTPDQLFGVTAGLLLATVLLGIFLFRAVGLCRLRARHRLLLDLVGEQTNTVEGALVIDDPRAAAFSLPGVRPRIVLSSGAVEVLSGRELQAVLAHERAHSLGHHDLALFPFETLACAIPASRTLASVNAEVRALLEMAADDRALRDCGPHAFVGALCALAHFEGEPTAVPTSLTRRAERALRPRRNARLLAFGSALSSVGLLALPVAVLASSGAR